MLFIGNVIFYCQAICITAFYGLYRVVKFNGFVFEKKKCILPFFKAKLLSKLTGIWLKSFGPGLKLIGVFFKLIL